MSVSDQSEGDGGAPVESPIGWVREHARRYEESGGTEGYEYLGVPCLLLTVRGRRTGKLRRTALMCGRDGDDFVVVGSKGGYAHHPLWFLNLMANPDVTVRYRTEVFPAHAELVGPQDRARLWPQMVELFPNYADYQAKTDREIPLVRLTRTAQAG